MYRLSSWGRCGSGGCSSSSSSRAIGGSSCWSWIETQIFYELAQIKSSISICRKKFPLSDDTVQEGLCTKQLGGAEEAKERVEHRLAETPRQRRGDGVTLKIHESIQMMFFKIRFINSLQWISGDTQKPLPSPYSPLRTSWWWWDPRTSRICELQLNNRIKYLLKTHSSIPGASPGRRSHLNVLLLRNTSMWRLRVVQSCTVSGCWCCNMVS